MRRCRLNKDPLRAPFSLRATGIPRRPGFVPADDSVKGALLTHGMGFQIDSSMWRSFLRLGRLIDPGLPIPDAAPLALDRRTVAPRRVMARSSGFLTAATVNSISIWAAAPANHLSAGLSIDSLHSRKSSATASATSRHFNWPDT